MHSIGSVRRKLGLGTLLLGLAYWFCKKKVRFGYTVAGAGGLDACRHILHITAHGA